MMIMAFPNLAAGGRLIWRGDLVGLVDPTTATWIVEVMMLLSSSSKTVTSMISSPIKSVADV